MKLIPLALTFAIGPFSLVAQNAAPVPVASSSNFNIVIGSDCPVSMQLEQRLGDQLVTVQDDGRVYKAPATQLMLTIAPGSPASSRPTPLRVAAATAIAYGFGGQPRAELVYPSPGSRGNGSSGPTRNLRLQFNANDGSSVAKLWLSGFGAVRSLELNSITWSDGSNWKPARGESCTVTPSLFMLVGADSSTGKVHP